MKYARSLGLKTVADVRYGLNVVVKHSQLIEQGSDVLVNRVFRDRISLGTDCLGNTPSRERVVRPVRQKEQNPKLDDAQLNCFLAEP